MCLIFTKGNFKTKYRVTPLSQLSSSYSLIYLFIVSVIVIVIVIACTVSYMLK